MHMQPKRSLPSGFKVTDNYDMMMMMTTTMMIVQTLTYLRSSYVLEGPAQVQFYESEVEIQTRMQ